MRRQLLTRRDSNVREAFLVNRHLESKRDCVVENLKGSYFGRVVDGQLHYVQ